MLADLSFNLGTPVHVLERMPVSALQLYEDYAAERLFPLDRLELYLARLSQQLDQIRLPGVAIPLDAYLLRTGEAAEALSNATPAAHEPATDAEAENIAQAMGFQPRKSKKAAPAEDTSNPSAP